VILAVVGVLTLAVCSVLAKGAWDAWRWLNQDTRPGCDFQEKTQCDDPPWDTATLGEEVNAWAGGSWCGSTGPSTGRA
jgi:hypothetical protein